ncbi:MAG TPA: YcfL family protein [Planctomycetota bacterium]
MRPLHNLLLSFAAGAVLAACSAPNAYENTDSSGSVRFVGAPSVDGWVEALDARTGRADSGLAVYQVDLYNRTAARLALESRARWFDEQGLEIEQPTRHWEVVFIPAGSREPVRSTAPNASAERCEMEIRAHQPITD